MLADIFSPLIGLGIPHAKKQCKTRVENLPAESWKSYFEGQADWLFELVEKCPSDFKLSINSMAVATAIALVAERAASLNPSERARFRRLMPRLNVHAERKIIEAVLMHSASHAKNVLGFLKAVESEATDFIANHATVEQLFTLIGGVSVLTAGRTCLEGQTPALQKGFSRVERKSRTHILDWFAKMKASTPRVRGNWIEIMEHRLGFDRK